MPPNCGGTTGAKTLSTRAAQCPVAHLSPSSNKTQQITGLDRISANHFQPGYFPTSGAWGLQNAPHSSHPCRKIAGTVGTNGKNARNSLSALNDSVPNTCGDKSLLNGDSGDSRIHLRSQWFDNSQNVAKRLCFGAKKWHRCRAFTVFVPKCICGKS